MKSKNYIYVVVAVIIVIAVCFAIKMKMPESQTDDNTPITATSTQAVKIVSYTNTKYRYTFNYPEGVSVQKLYEEDMATDTETSSIEIFKGGTSDVGLKINVYENKLDLKNFAEIDRQKFIDDKNNNFPNKNISTLEEITFAGKKAYSANVTGYTDGYGSNSYRLIYVSNGLNNFIIQYSLTKVTSTNIIDTLRFY